MMENDQIEKPGFDARLFMRTDFKERTEAVKLPDLAPFFGGDAEAATWTVRGLTGIELAQVNEAASLARNLDALVGALTSETRRDKIETLRAVLGIHAGDVPEDIVKRIEMLCLGSIEPRVERDVVIRIARVYPIEFYQLTNAITRLTGMGQDPGKSNGSGATPASEPH